MTIVRMYPGKVMPDFTGTASGVPTPTTTQFKSSGLSTKVGAYKNLLVTFTSGALKGQKRKVTAYNGAGLLTTAPFTVAPTPGDTFTIPHLQYVFGFGPRGHEEATVLTTLPAHGSGTVWVNDASGTTGTVYNVTNPFSTDVTAGTVCIIGWATTAQRWEVFAVDCAP